MIKNAQKTKIVLNHILENVNHELKNIYLNKKKIQYIEKNNTKFINCEITLDGEKYAKCEDKYFLSEDGNCLLTNNFKTSKK